MTTFSQLAKVNKRKTKKFKDNRLHLQQCPQKKATCLKVFIMTPRKPNSALRKVSRVMLSNFHKITAYIPGKGHSLQKHSHVLVRGGRVKDLPGIKYTMIRHKNTSLIPLQNRRNSRSKYGTPNPNPTPKGMQSPTPYRKFRL